MGTGTGINNNGAILMNAAGSQTWLKVFGGVTAALNGPGSITLGGDAVNNYLSSSSTAGFINNSIIQGGGYIRANIYNNNITNNGQIIANVHAGDISLEQLATLHVTMDLSLALSGNFAFAQKDPGLWNWGTNAFLAMDGAGISQQSLEIGGRDGGLVDSFFANNFDLNKLSLSSANTYAFLSDGIDNGHRSSSEALYVDILYVYGFGKEAQPHATLNLNGLHLYAMKSGSPYLVTIADDYAAWLGGGYIIDQAVFNTPLPATWLLFGSALLGLAGWRSRKR